MGLASGRSGLFSFQRTATRYLPFSYLRKSFTLPKASLFFFGEYESAIAVCARLLNYPESLSAFVKVTTGFFSLAPNKFSSGQGTDNVRSCSRGLVFVRRTNTASRRSTCE